MWWYGGPSVGMMGAWSGLHMLVGSVFWIGFLALGIMAMWRLVPRRQVGKVGESTSSAITTLRERYARGEIDRDEYLEKQRDLTASAAP